ncbi:hypothetical protein [Demequina silvatica]|uniref:hypothetical protein n=1 Tax=Demequina silvatica TaxID=1638988 RepID=UPI0007866A87|nr:hypothetical protein [Demequina silvatica]
MLKRIVVALAGAALAIGVAVPASADSTPKVDRTEFAAVKRGTSLTKVQSTFDATGKKTSEYIGTYVKSQTREWKTTTSEYGWVIVDFTKKNGVWVLDSKAVHWGVDATNTADKMTKAEFQKIWNGKTIAQVRSIAGTKGTNVYEYLSQYQKTITVEWPVDSEYGYAQVDFKWKNGAYTVVGKNAYWG